MKKVSKPEPDLAKQGIIWDYWKPRRTHCWNMLVLAYREIDGFEEADETEPFTLEYLWENFFIRLWLFRICILTLEKITFVKQDATHIIADFDSCFIIENINHLRALRDMTEHWDDYAADLGHGPATRIDNLDPWRTISKDRFEKGSLFLDRAISYDAAIRLLEASKMVSTTFTDHYKSIKNP